MVADHAGPVTGPAEDQGGMAGWSIAPRPKAERRIGMSPEGTGLLQASCGLLRWQVNVGTPFARTWRQRRMSSWESVMFCQPKPSV